MKSNYLNSVVFLVISLFITIEHTRSFSINVDQSKDIKVNYGEKALNHKETPQNRTKITTNTPRVFDFANEPLKFDDEYDEFNKDDTEIDIFFIPENEKEEEVESPYAKITTTQKFSKRPSTTKPLTTTTTSSLWSDDDYDSDEVREKEQEKRLDQLEKRLKAIEKSSSNLKNELKSIKNQNVKLKDRVNSQQSLINKLNQKSEKFEKSIDKNKNDIKSLNYKLNQFISSNNNTTNGNTTNTNDGNGDKDSIDMSEIKQMIEENKQSIDGFNEKLDLLIKQLNEKGEGHHHKHGHHHHGHKHDHHDKKKHGGKKGGKDD